MGVTEDCANLAVRRGCTGNVEESDMVFRCIGGWCLVELNPELGTELRCGDEDEVPLLSTFLLLPNYKGKLNWRKESSDHKIRFRLLCNM